MVTVKQGVHPRGGQDRAAPRGERKHGGWRLSPSATSGIIIGGVAGAAVSGPIAVVIGMLLGGVAGEALERYLPSKPEGDATGA
jgi:hypothetical protein